MRGTCVAAIPAITSKIKITSPNNHGEERLHQWMLGSGGRAVTACLPWCGSGLTRRKSCQFNQGCGTRFVNRIDAVQGAA